MLRPTPASAATSGVTAELHLLGAPALHVSGRRIALSPKDAALLALAVLAGPIRADRVAALLWPKAAAKQADTSLRQRLYRLRQDSGLPLLTSGAILQLTPDIGTDLAAALARIGSDAHFEPAELLGDIDYDDLPDLADWVRSQRKQWREQRDAALAAAAAQCEKEGAVVRGLVYAQRLIESDPLSEHAHRRVMRLHYLRGDSSSAIAAFERFEQRLKDELGARPSAETIELLQTIEGSAMALPVRRAVVPASLMRPPRLVGRATHWQALDSAWQARCVALVLGEAGIGKTRLLSDFAASRQALVVSSRPGDARVPFALLARLVRQLIGGDQAAPAASALDAWARAELAPIVPELGAASAAPASALRLQRAVEHVVSTSQVLGVVVDDLHFADDATLEMLPHLVHAVDGPRWLLASRSAEQPEPVRAWQRAIDAPLLRRIEVGPLDVVGVEELLASLALPELDAARWAERIHRHTGGNPMFILETLLAMPAPGPPGGSHLPLPDNLRVLIERRLSQLSPDALKLARIAALATQDFSVDLAAAVLNLHPLDLADAWRELEQAQVMRDNAFAHDLIFEVIREAIPQAVRKWLHRRIGQVLELHAGAASRLAHHWREADEPARAAASSMRAADGARALGRLSEESRWLDAAAESFALTDDAGGRFEALRRRASAALEARSPTDAFDAARSLCAAALDDRQRGIAHQQLGACHMNSAQFDQAAAEFTTAVAHSDAAGDLDQANHARYLRVLAMAQSRGVREAVVEMEALLPWAEGLADDALRNAFLADLAILCDQADQRRRARPYFEQTLAYFDAHRQTGSAASARMMYARCLMMLGDLPRACAQLETAVRERDELSEGEGGEGIEALNLGRVYCELGRYDQALRLLEPSRERLARHALHVVAAATALVLARIHAHLGQAARAQTLLKGLPDDLPYHMRAGQLWIRALLATERPVERQQLLGSAVEQFASADLPFVRLPMHFDAIASGSADAQALATCRGLIEECKQRELLAARVLGRMRLVQMLNSVESQADAALVEARAVLASLEHCVPVGGYLPEFHWVCHVAARNGGDAALAARCLADAKRWIAEAANHHVPEAFRDSFLNRNPVNRLILSAAV